jgi:hypothetical protein
MERIIDILPNLYNLTELYDTEDIKEVLKLIDDKNLKLLTNIIESNETNMIKYDLLHLLINYMMCQYKKDKLSLNYLLWIRTMIWTDKLNIV